ncbi:hypothetical protein XELAEV_18020031mg [Xenopus laevis]|uniref:Uncharacterized protein n=1 Tax=Xenopus laevis TaxID=8355 RepID=A0A974D701_XENLA|nr:hypothetical protein XELAEV_18020031mg [Xenopus laevis]
MGADPDYTFVVDNVPEGCPIDIVNHSLRGNPIFNAFEYVVQEPSDEKGFVRFLYWVPAVPSSDTWPSKVYPMGVSAEGCPCRYQSLPKFAQLICSPPPISLLSLTSDSSLWEEKKGCGIKDSGYAEIKMSTPGLNPFLAADAIDFNDFLLAEKPVCLALGTEPLVDSCPATPPPSPPPIPPRVGKVAVKEFCVAQPPVPMPYPGWVKKGKARKTEVPEPTMEPLPCATTRVEPERQYVYQGTFTPSERGMMSPACGVCDMEAPNALEDPDGVCSQCETCLWMGPFNRADQPPLVEKTRDKVSGKTILVYQELEESPTEVAPLEGDVPVTAAAASETTPSGWTADVCSTTPLPPHHCEGLPLRKRAHRWSQPTKESSLNCPSTSQFTIALHLYSSKLGVPCRQLFSSCAVPVDEVYPAYRSNTVITASVWQWIWD